MWDCSPGVADSSMCRVAGDTERSRTDAVTRQLSDNKVGSAGAHMRREFQVRSTIYISLSGLFGGFFHFTAKMNFCQDRAQLH